VKGLHREQVYTKDPNEEKEIGNSLYQQQKYAEAIKHYSNAISNSNSPVSAVLFANRAACYIKLKQYLLAVEDCDRSIQLDSTYVKAFLRKANALEHMKNYEETLKNFHDAKKLDKHNQFKEELDDGIRRVERLLRNSGAPLPSPRGTTPSPRGTTPSPRGTTPSPRGGNQQAPPPQQQFTDSQPFYPPPPPSYNNFYPGQYFNPSQQPPYQQPQHYQDPNANQQSNGNQPTTNRPNTSQPSRRERRNSSGCPQQ